MGFNFNSSDDTSSGGGNFLDVECWAHVQVADVDMNPKKKDGNMMTGAIGKLTFMVLAADQESAVKKTTGEIFFPPKQDSKDGGKFSQKKLTRLFVALGLMSPSDVGKNVDVPFESAKGRQIIAHFTKNKDGFFQIAWADIYHVDDLDKQSVPRNTDMIGQIPNGLRWTAEVARAWAQACTKESKKDDTPYSETVPQGGGTQNKFKGL